MLKNSSKLKSVHAEKISGISGDLRDLRSSLKNSDQMKVNFNDSNLHSGKILVTVEDINFNLRKRKTLERKHQYGGAKRRPNISERLKRFRKNYPDKASVGKY